MFPEGRHANVDPQTRQRWTETDISPTNDRNGIEQDHSVMANTLPGRWLKIPNWFPQRECHKECSKRKEASLGLGCEPAPFGGHHVL